MGLASDISRRSALAVLLGLPLAACETIDPSILGAVLGSSQLSQSEAAQGIRAALSNGVLSALGIVGRSGGFLNDGAIRIPLPAKLQSAQQIMASVGASGMLDQLETRLNRGAEKAAPVAKSIFMDAVADVSISDAIGIVRGPNNAATSYLQNKTTPALTQLFTPIMRDSLSGTGALQALDNISNKLDTIPFASQLAGETKGNLVSHGVKYGLNGVFYYIGKEEAAIRANPAKRSSEILRRVFG
ncbi:hypothetical protein MNBD_ALPHA06-1079 [hydrothermal vent metagenome]|uniref:DUF4197 domain-containing protein n=1 Tax=hydrothermal vent metagenome TaxID=652676 RepID=A0A3B0RH83_9ZZZZ